MKDIIIGVLIIGLLAISLDSCITRRDRDRIDEHRTELLTERLAAETRMLGYITELADAEQRILIQDEALREALAAAEARPITRTVTRTEVTADTTILGQPLAEQPDAWFGKIERSALYAEIGCIPPNLIDVTFACFSEIELLHSVTADGRLIVTGRNLTPGANLTIPVLEWSPPPPPRGPSRLRWLLGGIAIGVIGWELAR
jgi:hypothetical protein